MTQTTAVDERLAEARREAVDELVASATAAAARLRQLDQGSVDRIVAAMVRAGLHAATGLARLAVEETGFGVFEDKVVKNFVATEFLSDALEGVRTVGVVEVDVERNIELVAEPVGVVLAVTPVTNPTSTVLYKAILAAKTRNALLLRPS
ncbi:MAG TPA: aldehyde dehydrogenase family protein, partial [Marmoricola sp.]|nr:aldehyde dehydrogenase family protein [Marmoricola sp.]